MAEALVASLGLQPHPEGGFFKETYRSPVTVISPVSGQPRSASTAILFLVTTSNVSRMHRIASDEMWHFHNLGGSLTVVELDPETKRLTRTTLGADIASGERLQHLVKAGTWFGCYSNPTAAATSSPPSSSYSLVGCTVAPGFDFADFELASRAALLALLEEGEAAAGAEEGESAAEARAIVERLTEGLP